jgi:hypothetical protein
MHMIYSIVALFFAFGSFCIYFRCQGFDDDEINEYDELLLDEEEVEARTNTSDVAYDVIIL